MSGPIDVLIIIHGMVPEPYPVDTTVVGKLFYNKLVNIEPNLPNVIDEPKIYVQWGHEPPNSQPQNLREDQRLTRAESFSHQRVSYDAVRTDTDPNNILMSGLFGGDHNVIPGLRNIITTVRESIIHFGLIDAVYYCAPEGERYVRKTVYEQILTELDQFEQAEVVRMHIIGHSLGVILSHDFLFGLFAPDHEPDFTHDDQGSANAVELFKKWRQKAQDNVLQLGTLVSMASQLPVLLLRKQILVDKLFNRELLDPTNIGLLDEATVRWLIFYDIDDILGFTTRRLYQSSRAIKEIQVDTADWPDKAHVKYWENQTVIRETALQIYSNANV